jgi:hypothetical protein
LCHVRAQANMKLPAFYACNTNQTSNVRQYDMTVFIVELMIIPVNRFWYMCYKVSCNRVFRYSWYCFVYCNLNKFNMKLPRALYLVCSLFLWIFSTTQYNPLLIPILFADSNITEQFRVRLRTGRLGFDPWQKQNDVSYGLCVQTNSETHLASYPVGFGLPFLGGKALMGHDADHSPSSAEVKNE